MTRTEQIIAEYLDPLKGGIDADLIAEMRRLARLCDAYWAEIEAWRSVNESAQMVRKLARIHTNGPLLDEFKKTSQDAMNKCVVIVAATDAARREAGEGTT